MRGSRQQKRTHAPPARAPDGYHRAVSKRRDKQLEERLRVYGTVPSGADGTACVGRDAEVDYVIRRLTGPKDRSLLLLGPSGVGKTYLCKQLANFMFGDEDAVITMDMSEYMEKHNASRLVGAPPGYVGYEEGGQLTEKVRRRPYSVVLLDEIEKAHPDVFNMLLQIMEEGRLTDSFGRHVDFRNVILIMTSNLGSQQMKAGSRLGFDRVDKTEVSDDERKKRMRSEVMVEVERHFRPEFLNRLDELIVFNPLTRDDLAKIVHLQLDEVTKRLQDKGITLELSAKAITMLIDKGFSEDYGARPLRRSIERFIEDPLAEHILRNKFVDGVPIQVDIATDGESLDFQQTPVTTPVETAAVKEE
jgi:ATP-dependent Clp protease ATP-binding subunit ClpC